MSATTPKPGTILHCLHIKGGKITVSKPEPVASREFRLTDAEFVWGGSRILRRNVFPFADGEEVAGLPTAAPLSIAPTCTAWLYCEPADLNTAARFLRRVYHDAAKAVAKAAQDLAVEMQKHAAEAAKPDGFGGKIDTAAKL